MMRPRTRPNQIEWSARPPALIPVNAVEVFLHCFSAAEKYMNRKNRQSRGLRKFRGTHAFHEDDARILGIPPWSGTACGSYMAPHGSRSCLRGFFLHSMKRERKILMIFFI